MIFFKAQLIETKPLLWLSTLEHGSYSQIRIRLLGIWDSGFRTSDLSQTRTLHSGLSNIYVLMCPCNSRWCYLNKCNNNIYGPERTKKEDLRHFEVILSSCYNRNNIQLVLQFLGISPSCPLSFSLVPQSQN